MSDIYTGIENLEAMKQAVNYNAHLERLVRSHARGERVLDFGAGAGTFAKPLQASGKQVVCLEPDAALRGELEKLGLETCADLEQIPAGSMDYIYSLNVLEHIEDDVLAIERLYERLRPAGHLLLYVPAFGVLFSAMDRQVGHFRRYRRPELIALLRQAGFVIDEARYVDSLGFFATLAYKLLGDTSGSINVRSLSLYDRFVFPISRIVDRIIAGSFGKNLLLAAHRPPAS